MSDADDFKKLIREKKRRLQKLKEQEALYGTSVDPHILIQIEDLEADIEQLKDELAALEAGEPQSPATSNASVSTSTSFRQVKARNLEKRLADLIAEYEAANNQLSQTLSEVDRTRLKRQLETVEHEIEQVENDLNALQP